MALFSIRSAIFKV